MSEYEVVCHQQMLTVSIIPIRILQCQSGEYQFSVSVFDNDRKVFCPDYLPNGGLRDLLHIHH